jgi:HlyD family secretion protein
VLRVPNAALRFKPAGSSNSPAAGERRATRGNKAKQQDSNGTAAQVWMLDNTGQPQAVNIRIGLSNDEYSEVLSGALKDGDAVIVRAVRVD